MWAFVIYAIVIMGIVKPIFITGVDYDKHWFAARALLEGRSVYLGSPLWMGFNYPQATAFAYIWLGLFSVTTGEYVYKFSLLLLLIGCWWLAVRWFRPRPADSGAADLAALVRAGMAHRWGLTAAFLGATFYPATVCVYVGNIGLTNAFLAIGMVGALLTGAPLAAGVFWGLLTLVKMVPLVLLVPFLFWRQWRVIKGFLLVMAAYLLLLVVTGRVGQEWFFVHECMPKIPAHWRSIAGTMSVQRCTERTRHSCGTRSSHSARSSHAPRSDEPASPARRSSNDATRSRRPHRARTSFS
jgi:hypothetical protein